MRAHVYVTGTVQGVFYRASTRDRARARGAAGWVRNMSDGRVEAVFEGEEDIVRSMIQWCKKGPTGAHVDDVEVKWEEEQGLKGFDIRY